MKCLNSNCKAQQFCAVVEPDNNRIVGVKCLNCGARYTVDEIEIKKSVKRDGYWNSVQWELGM